MLGIKNRKLITSIALGLIMMLLLGSVQSIYAVDGDVMSDLRDSNGTLTVRTEYADEEEVTQINGIELTLYKVADLSVKNGDARYTMTDDFKSLDIDFNGMNASDSIDAAYKLNEVVKFGGLKGTKVVSKNGVVDFGSVSHGMYLVVQTGASGDAEEYSTLDPYLVMAPQPNKETGEWIYDVVSIPKSEVASEYIKITKTVNSKDNVEIEKRRGKFAYEIVAELSYAPEDFAIIDNVPEELEIVDKSSIEVRVGDEKLSDDVRDSMVTITGNTLRVQPTEAQMKQWKPFTMRVLFYCKFKSDVQDGTSVVNKAGYEVKGVYYEPPGDDNKAEVKGVFEDTREKKAKTKVKAANTGDYVRMYGPIIAIALAAAILIVMMVRRRRRDAE